MEALANAQYSQKEETAADEFGLLFLEQTGMSRQKAAESAAAALDKLASPDVDHTILSSHPEPAKRAARIRSLAGQDRDQSMGGAQDTAKSLSLTDRIMAALDQWISRLFHRSGNG